ncbi:MAG: hypothetical protein FWB91_02775 [Defluviitaleaceae bacterium]|nr:hypothetical protein [Defluviitaleaceae bacterium]
MRKREAIQPRKYKKAEADVFLFTVGSKNQPIKRGWGDSVGVNRAWRAYKVIYVYLGGLAVSAKLNTHTHLRAVGASKVLQTKRESKGCQKSDYFIVVMKLVKASGAKGVTNQRFSATMEGSVEAGA